jgi:hypothetical protein
MRIDGVTARSDELQISAAASEARNAEHVAVPAFAA